MNRYRPFVVLLGSLILALILALPGVVLPTVSGGMPLLQEIQLLYICLMWQSSTRPQWGHPHTPQPLHRHLLRRDLSLEPGEE